MVQDLIETVALTGRCIPGTTKGVLQMAVSGAPPLFMVRRVANTNINRLVHCYSLKEQRTIRFIHTQMGLNNGMKLTKSLQVWDDIDVSPYSVAFRYSRAEPQSGRSQCMISS